MQVGSRAATHTDMLAARVAILLDPAGPIRYRGIGVMPNGLGYLLGTMLIKGGAIQQVVEIMTSKLPSQWIEEQQEGRANHLHTLQQLEHAKMILERRAVGFGPERVAYELLPALPCLSPQVRARCPRNVRDLLTELNNSGSGNPTDRHVIAFILAREKRIPLPVGTALAVAAEGSAQFGAAILRIFAEAQNHAGPEKLLNLGSRLSTILEPATRRFFEKAAQEAAREQLREAASTGDLSRLVDAVDSGDKLDRDRTEFENARFLYAQAAQDIADLEADIAGRRMIELKVGQPIASGIAAMVGFGAIALVILMSIMGVF
jgi:hypothetical protein